MCYKEGYHDCEKIIEVYGCIDPAKKQYIASKNDGKCDNYLLGFWESLVDELIKMSTLEPISDMDRLHDMIKAQEKAEDFFVLLSRTFDTEKVIDIMKRYMCEWMDRGLYTYTYMKNYAIKMYLLEKEEGI